MMIQEARDARFSWITGIGDSKPSPTYDVQVAGNERYSVIPSMGSLVHGWLLTVPREPRLNLSGLSDVAQESLIGLINDVALRLHEFGGDVYCFEHGSLSTGSLAGCGVDQAHLHIVPLPFDLVSAAIDEKTVSWSRLDQKQSPLTQLPEGEEYIAIWRQSDGDGVVGSLRTPTSQWVRRLIAKKLGMGDEWNYRTHPQTEIISNTLARLEMRPVM